VKSDHWCYHCRASDDEPAGAKCTNPTWHNPNLEAALRAAREARDELEETAA